jgi:hypothetical protein
MVRGTLGIWSLAFAVAVTGLMAGLDHWGSFFPSRPRHRAQMPVDAVAIDPVTAGSSDRGARCICCHCVDHDDYAGDVPDEEPGDDRLSLWLCDDDGAQKQFALATAPDEVLSVSLTDCRVRFRPRDEQVSVSPSLNSLHVLLQI